jgi:hypothetical protein
MYGASRRAYARRKRHDDDDDEDDDNSRWPLLLLLLLLLLLAVIGLGIWGIVIVTRSGSNADTGLLVLHDSQRLVLGSSLVIPIAGDQDIVLIRVTNNNVLLIVNITIEVELVSAARKRAPVSLSVICPPLYVDNFIASLAPSVSTTCRALYTLTSDDIVNGNVLTTTSSGVGTSVDDITMSVTAVPGASDLSINNLEIAEGAVLGIPGPTTNADVDVVSAPCEDAPPHTTLTCAAGNELQLLFCDFSSNSTQQGHIYMCVGSVWVFFGAVDVTGNETTAGPTGPTGPQGIGVYAATCSGGLPPTSVINPTYTCDSAFNLNMVLCALPSTDGNAGIIYECLCSPACAWTEVANINGAVEYTDLHCFGVAIDNTPNVWSNLCHVSLPKVGSYYCLAEGNVQQTGTTQACPLTYGISRVSQSNVWISNSDRNLNLPPIPTNPTDPPTQQWTASIITTALVLTTTAPTLIYLTAGIGNQTVPGCGDWDASSTAAMAINCILVELVF